MDEQFDSLAYDALNSAATYMMARSPGMAEFYRIMRKRQSDAPHATVRIMMESGHPVLEYGVAFVRDLERSLLGSILYMQCMKVSLHHCDRRRREPADVYKLASDLVVAEYGKALVDASVPGNLDILSRLYPSVWDYWDRFRDFDFDPAKDLYLEKVFEILAAGDEEEGDGQDSDGAEDSGDSDESGGSGGSGSDSDDAGKNGDGTPDGGSNSEDGESSGDPADGGQGDGDTGGTSSGYAAMERYFSGDMAETDLEGWTRDEMATANIQSAADRADRSGFLARMPGNLPVMIASANRIRVNTRALFRHFVDSIDDDDQEFTWNRRDRRLPRTDYVTNPGRVVAQTHRILLAADVSGSMYFCNAIPQCIRLMDGIVNGIGIDVCYWDGACSEIYDAPRSMSEVRVTGGGSTDPECVLRRVHDEHRVYDGIVFLTDCEFEWACPRYPRRIMIIRTGTRAKPPAWCQFVAELDALLKER